MQRLEFTIRKTIGTSDSMSGTHSNLYAQYVESQARLLCGTFLAPTDGVLYKFKGQDVDVHVMNKIVHKTKIKKNLSPRIEESIVIQLGGTFEKIGDEEEFVGGGDQKIGNK